MRLLILSAVALLTSLAPSAYAETVYEYRVAPFSTLENVAAGNANPLFSIEYGDVVTLGGTDRDLESFSFLLRNDSSGSSLADISVNLYEFDSSTFLPTSTTPIFSQLFDDTVIETGSNFINFGFAPLTFALPESFAATIRIADRSDNPTADGDGLDGAIRIGNWGGGTIGTNLTADVDTGRILRLNNQGNFELRDSFGVNPGFRITAVAAIPEPGSAFAFATVGVVAFSRRRRRRSSQNS